MKKHDVEIRIPAVIVLRGKAAAESPEGAKGIAEQEVAWIRTELAGRPILEGHWPEVIGGAHVTAVAVENGEATIAVGE